MHITLEADYAVRIVHALAQSGKRLDAKTISEMTGYEIGKPAEEISLGEVIETIEGRYTLNRCVTGEYACTRHKNKCCEFQKIFREISEDVRKRLYSYHFSDFMEK